MSDFQFGVCTSFKDKERLQQAKAAGAQYYEINFGAIFEADEAELNEFSDFTKTDGLPCYAANGMFPERLKLVGPAVDYSAIDEYLDKASQRFAALGGKTVVFGSGRARRCPDDFSKDKAFEQLVCLCSEHITPFFKKHGLVCAIEPLRSSECNMVTTAKRGYEICKAAGSPQIKLLIDLFHFDCEKEERESILNYKDCLQHMHIASATNERKYPKPNDGTDYKQFLDLLRLAEYMPRLISLEGRSDNFFEESKVAFDLLKTL